MKKKVVIYTKPNCPQCHITQIRFHDHHVPCQTTYYGNKDESNEVDILSKNPKKRDWSLQKINDLKQKYHVQALPFVKVINAKTGEILDSWTHFRPNKIDEVINENNENHNYIAE
jgi:glutaredoxin